MDIDCEKVIDKLDNIEDYFSINFQNILIMRVIQNILCEMLIGRRKKVYTDSFCEVTNIRKDVRNSSSSFYGLLHEMVSNEPFINQVISYINKKVEMNCSTVTDYIIEYSNII